MDEKKNLYTFENREYRDTYRHSASHVLAQAVKRLYPESKLAIGPAIENGFYYDIDSDVTFTPEVLEKIEAEMRKICKEKLPIERFELPRAEAIKFMADKDEPYKVELIEDLPEDAVISFYKQGEFTDLCAGPHLDSTGRIKGNAIKLMNCTGAYWRGDSNRKMLQRIYGTCFMKKEELDEYLARLEEAKKRDHRKLGRELGLFMMNDAGPGFPFFLPNGMTLKNTLIDYWREIHKRYGYVEISTPVILNRELWERSGHWDHYKDNMYTTVIDGQDYAIKPMNCPGGMLVYESEPHSYRDLPLRVGELGLVHRPRALRHTRSRVPRQVLHAGRRAHLHDPRADEGRDKGRRAALRRGVLHLRPKVRDRALHHARGPYRHRRAVGAQPGYPQGGHHRDGQDLRHKRGRRRVLRPEAGLPSRGQPGAHLAVRHDTARQPAARALRARVRRRGRGQAPPVMIHRVVLGSIERFIGVITEHFGGAFPTWLAPVQVKVMPITDRSRDYAQSVADELAGRGIRVETDFRNEKIGYKIREAQSREDTLYARYRRQRGWKTAPSPSAPAPAATRAPSAWTSSPPTSRRR